MFYRATFLIKVDKLNGFKYEGEGDNIKAFW